MFGSFDIIHTLMILPGILLGFVLHEFAHAKMSDLLGDPTPRMMGRLTLDPKVHIDIIGFIMILLVGFGWAKPVTTDRRYYKHPKRDDILVSLAGPLMNLLLAIFFLLLLKVTMITGAFSTNEAVEYNLQSLLAYSADINVLLFVLNLLPFPFFDGYHVISNLFNTWKYRFFALLEQYNMIIFILLAVTRVFDKIITPPVEYIFTFLYRIII